ncbi:hemagglutinin repeat-containing protein [Fusobacterium animalis]
MKSDNVKVNTLTLKDSENRKNYENTIINNVGSEITGKNISIEANNDIGVVGSDIKAKEKLTLNAKNVDISSAESSLYERSSNRNGYTINEIKRNTESNIEAQNINMEAKKDIDIKGSNIVAKEEANIKAAGDVNIVSATDSDYSEHKESHKKSFGRSSSEEKINYSTHNVASNIIGDKVNITSGKDVNIFGSNVGAKDTGNISAKGTITEAATKDVNYSYHKKTKTGFMGLTGKSSAEKIHQELNAESNLYVKNQGIIDGDIKVIGSNLVLGNNSIINGKLTTDSNELHNSYSYEESKKGFSGSIGGGGFSVGYGKSESGLKEKDVINAKSNLVLGDGTVLNKGADITATNLTHGKITVNNGDVKFGARKDTKDVETYSKSSGVNLSVRIKSQALDRAKQGVDSFKQMKSGDILGGIASSTNTVTGVISGLASNQGTKLPLTAVKADNTVGKDNLKLAEANNNFYANMGVNLGFNKSSSKSNSHSESAVVTTIQGKDKNSSITYNNVKNIEYVGTQVKDTKFIYNNVDNITKKAVELNNSYSSDSKSSGVSAGVNIGYGRKVLTDNASVSVSSSKSNMNSNGTSYQNGLFVNVDEEHNNTKNMTLSGFNQVGGKVTGNIENLTIESKQNTSTTTGSTKSGSIGFAPNGMPTSISANYSQTNGERKYVDDPTTFIIGDGSNLKVGKVENTAAAIGTSGNGKLSIDEYVGHNLENKDKTTTKGGSVSLSQSSIPISGVGVNYANRDLESVTKNTVIGNVEIGKSSGDEINKDLDTMTEVTKDEDTKTNVFVESQTIKYALNPEAFKQDLEKAKNEITDMGNVVENTVNPKGLDKRNILENLRAQRGGTTLYNVVGSRVEALDKAFKDGIINEEEYKEAVRKVIKGYGKDIGVDFEVVYLDEKTMPKDAKGSTGSAFINKETEKMLIPIDVNKIKDTGSLWGVIAEEVSHIQDGLEGRQDKKVAEDETNKEKGLESLGRPINDYVKNKLGDDNSSDIQLSTDGIDLTNANVGEKVGDYFPKQEIDAAGGVKKVFGWDPDKGITLTETGHFLTGFSEAILADMLLNPNLIPEKYKYRSLAYKYGELTGHSTMIGVGCIGSVSGECLQGVGVGAAGGTAGASLGISWVGVGVETYSLGLTTVSTINAAKTNSQISAMKAVGSSGSGGTNNSDENSEKKEENINKDDKGSENNKEPNNDEKKQTPKKPEDNFNKKTNPNASTNKTQSGKATLNEGKQGKHVVGHNNFQQGKSEVDMETARNVLNDFQDTGQKFFDENGQKLKEVVDTNGKYMGIFVDKDTGQRSITSRFTIHYDSKGTAHIVPANPNPK